MNNIGDHFKIDSNNKITNMKNVFIGNKYRISVLTDKLIRLEYSETGKFFDNLTERVVNRNFKKVDFITKEDENYLEIKTKCFKLEYQKNKPFLGSKAYPSSNLRITVLKNEKRWYYGSEEVKNYGGSIYDISDLDNIKFEKGLYSEDGFASIDESNSLIFNEDGVLVPKEIKTTDIYVFSYANDFKGCLEDYFELTGKPELIPRYALGIWWSKNKEYSYDNIKNLLNKFKSKEIPLSVFLFDKPWFTKFTDSNKKILDFGYTINRSLIPDTKLIKTLFENYNIKLGLNIDPSKGLSKYEESYDKISQYLNTTDEVIPMNLMSTVWLETYFKVLIHSFENIGVDFIWNDYFPAKDKINDLFLLNHYQYKDINRLNTRRSFVLSRNTNIAPHRYPIVYSGRTIVSFDTLKLLPQININGANMGISFISHDVGGFHKGMENQELYLRYIQLSTFSPIFRFSSESGKYYKKEPWKNEFKTLTIAKQYIDYRYKLIPYIYSETNKYRNNCNTLVKPMYYDIPNMYYDDIVKNQYYFGTELLVCPIISKKDLTMKRVVQRLYLPEGVWFEFFSAKKYVGGRDYVTFYNDEEYPVFAKSGSIIIQNNDNEFASIKNPKSLEILVFPGTNNSYDFYEDDGVSNKYKDGQYIITNFNYTYDEGRYNFVIKPKEGIVGLIPDKRNYKIRFKNVRLPDEINIYNNNELLNATTYVEDADYVIELHNISTNNQISISCIGNNMMVDNLMIINDEIDQIISDLPLNTVDKENINKIMFSDLAINKKRIKIKQLKIEKLYIKLFIKLLEYVSVNL